MKILGFVPARMKASRFPGKPLHPIAGRPLLEHCYLRAGLYDCWDVLSICTCDDDIHAWAEDKGYSVIMTADTHTRALDRVAEAAEICGGDVLYTSRAHPFRPRRPLDGFGAHAIASRAGTLILRQILPPRKISKS